MSGAQIWNKIKEEKYVKNTTRFEEQLDFRKELINAHEVLRSTNRHQNTTVYFLPLKNNACKDRYNYFCKFWFSIRCSMMGAFKNVEILQGPLSRSLNQILSTWEKNDIVLIVWKSNDHKKIPNGLEELKALKIPIKIGVFHIANEVDRYKWPWYEKVDFVLRNYWISVHSSNILYIPLAPQMPSKCVPETTRRWEKRKPRENLCSCIAVSLKIANERKFLWSFVGSMRGNRKLLQQQIDNSKLIKDLGTFVVAKKFGGDGEMGFGVDDPKNNFLNLAMESAFVFAPCGNVMETHRIYEAIKLGAIPVIERCGKGEDAFFGFRDIVFDTTLEMVVFVEGFISRPKELEKLQIEVQTWWEKEEKQLALNVSKLLMS